jgi:Cytochrome c554 and c-prime
MVRHAGLVVRGLYVVALAALVALGVFAFSSAPSANGLAMAADAPAAQGTYTGAKRCAGCHFKEFMAWKKTPHSKAYENMAKGAPKYAADPECLKCHITAYGIPGGYRGEATPDLVGVSCEACHGPGSAHEEVAKKYTNVKVLSAEQKKEVNSTIHLVVADTCIKCHLMQQHKEHPKYEGQKK